MPQAAGVPTTPEYRAYDVVETRAAVWSDGHLYPSGSECTIVHVHPGGSAFEVEFEAPVPAVVTLEAGDLGAVRWRA